MILSPYAAAQQSTPWENPKRNNVKDNLIPALQEEFLKTLWGGVKY